MDKLANILSSNCCENYFGVLVKFSEGKRLNLYQIVSRRALQTFVAGLRSNTRFRDDIRVKVGLHSAEIKIINTNAIKKRRLDSHKSIITIKQTKGEKSLKKSGLI